MGNYIFLFIAIIFFFGIIKGEGVARLIWFFSGVLFFQGSRIILLQSPTLIDFNRLLIYSLLIAELFHPKTFYQNLKDFPLFKPLLIVFIGIICTGLFDPRHGILLNLYRSTDEFIKTFLVVFLTYTNLKKLIDWRKLIKFLLIASVILGFYGLFVFLIKANPIDSFITNTYHNYSFFDQYAFGMGRFRVNSLVSHPIYYGYLCSLLILLELYWLFFKNSLKKLCIVSIFLTFINLILTNSRTPIIALAVGLLVFVFLERKSIIKIRFLIYCALTLLLVSSIPFVENKISNTISIFETGGEKVSGSSLKMRKLQLEASYNVFLQKPFWGNGLYYIREDLGWNINSEKRTSANDFQGFESYIYDLLIEEGVIGILANVIFFIAVVIYFLKSREIQQEFSTLGITIQLMFLTFIIGTGPLGTWFISLGLTGILIKLIELKKEEISYDGES